MDIIVEEIPQQDDSSPIGPTHTDSIEHLSLASQFRINNPTKEEEGMLAEVYALGKQVSKTKEITDVIWQVQNIMHSLGTPPPGQSSLAKIYRYAKLRRQATMIEEQLKNEF